MLDIRRITIESQEKNDFTLMPWVSPRTLLREGHQDILWPKGVSSFLFSLDLFDSPLYPGPGKNRLFTHEDKWIFDLLSG